MATNYVVVDVESDGPIIGVHSIVCFGAVLVKEGLETTFYGECKPLTEYYEPKALAVSGISREKHLTFPSPEETFKAFNEWLKSNNITNPVLISDNNGYDASWINYYFHRFLGKNPFGWSSRRIGDMYAGFMNNPKYQWKKHRTVVHDHNPVNDAKGNAGALLHLKKLGFNLDN